MLAPRVTVPRATAYSPYLLSKLTSTGLNCCGHDAMAASTLSACSTTGSLLADKASSSAGSRAGSFSSTCACARCSRKWIQRRASSRVGSCSDRTSRLMVARMAPVST